MLSPSGMVSSKCSTGLGLVVAIWLPRVDSMPKNEAMQQQAKLKVGSILHLDASFDLMDLVFLKQDYSSMEMFGKKTDSCLSLVCYKILKLPQFHSLPQNILGEKLWKWVRVVQNPHFHLQI